MSHDLLPPADPAQVVIFGASGDLTKRKLIPALYQLWCEGRLSKNFAILGVARSGFDDAGWRKELYDFNPKAYDAAKWAAFAPCIHYVAADSTQASGWPAITARVREVARQHGTSENILFYLSVSPQHFEPVIANIGASGLVTEGRAYCSILAHRPWQRIVIEKPFGSDPASARQLNMALANVFEEESTYRIDHYLGKELVQNLMVLRFANSLFEPIWNEKYIDHVQITAAETVGVEGRGSYYDSPSGGAMRDMVQSHLLQVLSVVAMEPPVSLDAADVRTEKVKVFKALRVPTMAEVPFVAVRGQYGAGNAGGKALPDYRAEQGVAKDSQVDTYTAMKFFVDTWRWGGVPFYLRSGKAMAKKRTEIAIYFKPAPHSLFRSHLKGGNLNQLLISIHPEEGVRIRFAGKEPGTGLKINDVVMEFDYVEQWKVQPPDGYATLLHDAIRGDQTLFKHRDEIDCSWSAVQPVLDYWAENPDENLPNYIAGSWGPSAADEMMGRDGRHWRTH